MRSGVVAAALVATALSISRIDSDVISGANSQLSLALLTLSLSLVAVLIQLGARADAGKLHQPSRRQVTPRSVATAMAWAAWPLVGLVGAVGSNDPTLAVVTSSSFLACGLGIHLLVRDQQLAAMVVLGMFTALAISATAATGWLWSDFDQHPDHLRLLAIEANSLSQSFLWLIFWIGCALTYRRVGRSSWPLLMLGATATLGLALTQSRTAALAAMVGVSITIVVDRAPKLRPLVLISAASLVVISAGFLLQTVIMDGPVTASTLGGIRRMTGRADIWPAVVDAINERPWLGYGFGSGESVTAGQAVGASLGWLPRHTHNLFLHLLVVSGWIGLLAFCGGLMLAVVRAWRNGQRWVIGIVFVLFIDGVAEAVLIDPSLAWASVVALATAGAPVASMAGETATGWRPSKVLRPPIVVGVSVVVAAVVLTATVEWARLPFRARCGDEQPIEAAPTPLALNGPPVVMAPGSAEAVRCLGRNTDALSVTLFVAPAKLGQDGPARLLSLSDGLGWRDIDFELAVETTDLVVRLRTSEGIRTDTIVPNVFTTTESVHLGVVLEPTMITVYVDGEPLHQWEIDGIRFASWDPDRALTLGNDSTGQRPFLGTVRMVAIAGGALQADEVRQLAGS